MPLISVLLLQLLLPHQWEVRFYAPNSPALITQFTIDRTGTRCGQDRPTGYNPKRIAFEDPMPNGGWWCIWEEAPIGGPLSEIPPGIYDVTITGITTQGRLPESGRAPYRKNPPVQAVPVPRAIQIGQ